MVEVEVQPGSAHGDHPAGIEHLAAGVGLAAVVLENDAGRTLQLIDDDALGAVDDEGAFFGHQGQGAEIDVLLLDVADGPVARRFIGVVDDQTHFDAHGRFIGQTLGNALGLIVLGLLNFVADEFQAGGLIEILNGKYRVKDAFQAFVRSAIGLGHAFLKEFLI